MIGIVYCSSVQKHLTVFEDIRTARGVVCYLINIIIQKAGKEVRVCEVTVSVCPSTAFVGALQSVRDIDDTFIWLETVVITTHVKSNV